jgi:putative restriction endonuclease
VPESGALSELSPRCPGRYGGRNGVLETMNIRPDYATIEPEEFFAWVSGQEGRYELVKGEVVMMAGSVRRHDAIAVNLIAAIRPQPRSGPCHTFTDD